MVFYSPTVLLRGTTKTKKLLRALEKKILRKRKYVSINLLFLRSDEGGSKLVMDKKRLTVNRSGSGAYRAYRGIP